MYKVLLSIFILLVSFHYLLPQESIKNPKHYSSALLLYQKGKHYESLKLIRSVITVKYKPYKMRMLAAANYSKLGKYQNAIDHILYCIKENHARIEPKIFLMGLYRKTGSLNKAIKYGRRLLKKYNDNLDIRQELARIYYLRKKYKFSRMHTHHILRINKNHFDALFLEGLIFLKESKYENAEFRFRHALNFKTQNIEKLASLYNNLGFTMEKKGDKNVQQGKFRSGLKNYSRAEKMYHSSIKVIPDSVFAKKNLVRILKKRNSIAAQKSP